VSRTNLILREKRFSKNETKGSMKEEEIKLINNSKLLQYDFFSIYFLTFQKYFKFARDPRFSIPIL